MDDQFIGNYKVLKKIGAGGMAKVYLAVHKDIPNLKVVLKILSDARLVERFKQEADKLALLDGHGSICQIKHFFNHGEEMAIAMEFIDGTTLEALIEEKKKMSVCDSVKICSDVLGTLEFAHQKGIYHRDIKPGNIMIDKNGRVKIIDFGIAKAETDPNLTVAGYSVGTPAYMAPEQFTPTADTNYAQVDVYAVGTMLYYMLTGELPFKGDNQFVIREAKLFSEPKHPRVINREVPRQLEDIILKAMDRDPEERYKNCTEMLAALRALPVNAEISKETVHAETPEAEKPPEKKGPFVRVVSVAAALIFIAAAVYVAFFTGEEKLPPDTPGLFMPSDGAVLNTARPEFSWSSVLEEGGSYIFQYDNDSLFSNPTTIPDLSRNSFTFQDSLENGLYFWRIKAVDNNDLQSEYSNIFSFTIDILPPEAPQGMVVIAVKPSGDIFIDGNLYSRNREGAEIPLDTGRHVIRVRNSSSNEKAIDKTITLTADAREELSFNFTFPEPEPVEPTEKFGRLSVGSKPLNGAVVYIDGKRQERQTPNTYNIKAGNHVIRAVLMLDDREITKIDTILVAKDSTSKVIFDFEE